MSDARLAGVDFQDVRGDLVGSDLNIGLRKTDIYIRVKDRRGLSGEVGNER